MCLLKLQLFDGQKTQFNFYQAKNLLIKLCFSVILIKNVKLGCKTWLNALHLDTQVKLPNFSQLFHPKSQIPPCADILIPKSQNLKS